jgi:hypothetical protein
MFTSAGRPVASSGLGQDNQLAPVQAVIRLSHDEAQPRFRIPLLWVLGFLILSCLLTLQLI